MTFVFTIPVAILSIAALVALYVAGMSWRRRMSPGGVSFFLMMCAVFLWATGSALETAVIGIPAKQLFAVLSYIGSVNVAPCFFVFALRYRRQEWRPTPLFVTTLWLIPAATLVLTATNSFHKLIWSNITLSTVPGSTAAVYSHGPWYWVAVTYYALLGLAAAAAMIGAAVTRPQKLFMRQTVIMLTGLAIPWAATVLGALPIDPFSGLDLPPAAFALTGVLILLGMRRYHLFDIVPVARDILLETMADGLIVVDSRDRIVDINPAARRLCNASSARVGANALQALGALGAAFFEARAGNEDRCEVALSAEPLRHLDMHVSTLRNRLGDPSGWLLELRDVTERRELEMQKEKLIAELQAAASDIKTLSGLLPICSSCKKIRDDQGYWRTLEKYITEHSEAQFSHGLCNDCAQKLYPELFPE